jgi:phosphoglycolate phosphatase-like HAD superfamily hydrolase
MIGDTSTDMQTAKSLGLRAVLVLTGKAGRDGLYDVAPDYRFDTFAEAVDFILAQDTQPAGPNK